MELTLKHGTINEKILVCNKSWQMALAATEQEVGDPFKGISEIKGMVLIMNYIFASYKVQKMLSNEDVKYNFVTWDDAINDPTVSVEDSNLAEIVAKVSDTIVSKLNALTDVKKKGMKEVPKKTAKTN